MAATKSQRPKLLRSLAEVREAGRQAVRDNGWSLSDEKYLRLAELVRPHLERMAAEQNAS